jgi:hypothetical protein
MAFQEVGEKSQSRVQKLYINQRNSRQVANEYPT